MGWFSNYVSDPPGNADAIAGVKDGLSDTATNANAAENDLSSIKSSISTWAGQARDNYDEACLRGTRRLYNFNEGLQSAKSDVFNSIPHCEAPTPNGEFTISWDDFEKYYGDVAIGSLW